MKERTEGVGEGVGANDLVTREGPDSKNFFLEDRVLCAETSAMLCLSSNSGVLLEMRLNTGWSELKLVLAVYAESESESESARFRFPSVFEIGLIGN